MGNDRANFTSKKAKQPASGISARSGSEPLISEGLVDTRPEALTQMKLQHMADQSHQVKNLWDFQEIADKGQQPAGPGVLQRQAVIQRDEWDLMDLEDKGSQEKSKFNSITKSLFDTLGEKTGKEGIARLGSVHTRLELVKEALTDRNPARLQDALTALRRQFKDGSPPYMYIEKRLMELKANSQAAMNTMAAYHNLRKTGAAAPPKEADHLAQMRAYILSAKDAYMAHDYQTAHNLLFDNTVAKSFGFRVDIIYGKDSKKNWIWYGDTKDLIDKAMPVLERAMAFHTDGDEKISLPYILPIKGGPPPGNYLDFPELARVAIPVYLEEWMHKMQYRMRQDKGISEDQGSGPMAGTGQFWSQNTADFAAHAQKTLGPDASKNSTMVYNEIDILAAFHDWGFPVEELGTVGGAVPRYQGREQFWAWLHGV
ncbi:MAG: hypothetical protein IPJ00_19850 [Saprospirales bacterium]|nr:hypothetical protein [Saprospirales bacterium]